MVNGFDHMKKFSSGARELMEAGFVDSSAGRFSRTVFMSTTRRASRLESCAIEAALKQGFGLISLEFGNGSKAKGPRCFSVTLAEAGGAVGTTHDCMLAIDADGRYVLVPRGAVPATFHFAVGPNGLERRHGRPSNLAALTMKAMRDLIAAAKKASLDGPFIEAHDLGQAA